MADGPAAHEERGEREDGASQGDEIEEEDAERGEHRANEQLEARSRLGSPGWIVREPEVSANHVAPRR